jgi:hypothetical protein
MADRPSARCAPDGRVPRKIAETLGVSTTTAARWSDPELRRERSRHTKLAADTVRALPAAALLRPRRRGVLALPTRAHPSASRADRRPVQGRARPRRHRPVLQACQRSPPQPDPRARPHGSRRPALRARNRGARTRRRLDQSNARQVARRPRCDGRHRSAMVPERQPRRRCNPETPITTLPLRGSPPRSRQ